VSRKQSAVATNISPR